MDCRVDFKTKGTLQIRKLRPIKASLKVIFDIAVLIALIIPVSVVTAPITESPRQLD
jgi:hypothetical protein